jgi:hypothetical protein
MTRLALLLIAAVVAGCASQNTPLPMVKDSDPVVRLNADQCPETVNDLTHPPGDGAPQRMPKL